MRVHRNVAFLKTRDETAMAEIKSVLDLDGVILAQAGPTGLIIEPGKGETMLKELRKAGYTPRVVRGCQD